ncbi:protein crumbs homolog 2-like [Pocillopora verrucosa]|uniref:protein crumbs homolog 2-like n=1 Tax=Pocillopora verrucosa TaxID=203993 RepID=UPI00333F10B6
MIFLVHFSFFLLIFHFKSALACLDGNCRILAFPSSLFFKGERLVNHTTATISVIDRDTCEFRCYLEHSCVSINFNVQPKEPETENCELNNSTGQEHEKDLIKAANYVYHGTNNACGDSPCENNATCQSGFTSQRYRCLCSPGFTGHDCEHVVDKCNSNPCQNQGSCIDGKCQCQPRFSGELCEIEVGKCNSNPCQNQGSCKDGKCQCQPGFSGELCQIEVDKCNSNPCQNQGSCKEGKCQCQPGFSGELCEIVIADQCDSSPCQNNSICVGGKCECLPGYSGENCKEDVDECSSGVHSCHSSASCINTIGSYTCSCNNLTAGDGKTCNLASECQNYWNLTSGNRRVTSGYDRHCDWGLYGWYRFSEAAGIRMATSCPRFGSCGSTVTGWLSGGHPSVADGEVSRSVCFRSYLFCCRWSRSIKVRNCGAYYVYYLRGTPFCNFRYCSTG